MASIPYFEPQAQGQGNNLSPNIVAYPAIQNAAWRRGDFLIRQTVGTIYTPPATYPYGGSGTLAGAIAPPASAVTITQTAAAGAPAQTYYVIVSYANTAANEGSASQEFVVNSLSGYVPSVSVAAAGAPSGSTAFNVYVGLYPQTEVRQGVNVTLGTTYTNTYPLAASVGMNRGATGTATNILGLAINSSFADFYSGTGGSFNVNEMSLFGATNSQPPLTPAEPYLYYVEKLQNGTQIEISLRNTVAWSPILVGTAVGLYLDPTTGFFVADPAQTQVGNIVSSVDGVQSVVGQAGDVGKRVVINFLNSVLI